MLAKLIGYFKVIVRFSQHSLQNRKQSGEVWIELRVELSSIEYALSIISCVMTPVES
jgi:hypothetical protein